jgi:hypothetical protein
MNEDYLDQIINSSLVTLLENVFIKKFIPLLLHPNPLAFNLTWVNEVAKSPHVRVYIVNKDKTVLFSVPPLRDTPLNNDNPGLTNTLNYIQLEINRNTQHGNQILELNLPKLIDTETKISQGYAIEWKHIFDRYGLSDRYVDNSDKNKINDTESLMDTVDDW